MTTDPSSKPGVLSAYVLTKAVKCKKEPTGEVFQQNSGVEYGTLNPKP